MTCHRIGGEGGTAEPDLGKTRGRNYSPASIDGQPDVELAPAMGAAAKRFSRPLPMIEAAEKRDLLSYLWDNQIYGERGNRKEDGGV